MLLTILLVFYAGCFTETKPSHFESVVYVSKVRGKAETDACGTNSLPCKTLQVGMDKLAWGGQLFVDGEHTHLDPYTCRSSAGKLVAQKSFSIQSYTTTAQLSCALGIHIMAPNDAGTEMNINITGVQLKNTVLYLRNANVTIQGCTFLESQPAIDVKNSNNLPLYSLSIVNSVFERNHGCIDFTQGVENHERRCSHVALKLKNVLFRENTAQRGDVTKSGLVFVDHKSCFYCKVMSFSSFWENVTAARNQGKEQVFDGSSQRKRVQNYPNMYGNRFSKRGPSKPNLILDSLFVVYTCSANITLNRITSDYNRDMRFLGLQSCYSNVRIYKSGFHRHIISGPGGVLYIPKGEVIYVDIKDSDFSRNVGSIGGVLQIDGGTKKRAILRLSNVSFLYCTGNVTGCAISIGKITRNGVNKVFAFLKGVEFNQCHNRIKRGSGRVKHGPLCLQASQVTHITILDSIFRFNRNTKGSSVKIIHSPTKNKDSTFCVNIERATFQQNTCDTSKPTLGIFIEKPTLVKRSSLTLSDSVFAGNRGRVISIDNIQNIRISNITCNDSRGLCYEFYIGKQEKLKNTPPGLNATLLIENSTFFNNYQSFNVKYVQPNFVDIQVRNVIIAENNRGVPAFFQFGSRRLNNLSITGSVLFERLYFISNTKMYGRKPHLFSVVVHSHDGNISFAFRQSVFRNNFHKQTKNKLHIPDTLFFLQMPEDLRNPNSSDSKCSEFPTYSYKNTFMFEEVIIENNTGPSFIMFIANGRVSFDHCLFKNNYCHEPKTGAHLFIQEGATSVEFSHTNFIQTRIKSSSLKPKLKNKYGSSSMLFVFAGARGPLLLRNSSFVASDSSERVIPHFTIQTDGFVYFDNYTKLLCPVGSFMDLEDGSHLIHQSSGSACINITQRKFTCKMCGVGKYSLERGFYQRKLNPITCFEFCPFGADCTWNVQSRANFWGYRTSDDPPRLNFTRCPDNYCHVPRSKSNTSVYNRCSGNRTGLMCGACKEGFTESMFNHKCRPVNKCRDRWFWVIVGVYSVIVALYILRRPPIVIYLVNNLLWFRHKKALDIPSTIDEQKETDTGQHGGHGYSKIIFYFYQIADLLMIDSCSEILRKHVLISSLISMYNFQVKVADSSFGCPFPGLTAVTKEIFCSLQVYTVMVVLVAFYFLHWLLCSIRKTPRPLFAPYLAAIIEILLLGYERLGHTSLKLLNCTPLSIHGRKEWRLVLDGNITCWVHWWQYAMIGYNIVFVIPFLLVLLVGTSKLKRQEISAWHFVAASFVPLPFLLYWMLMYCLRRFNEYGRRPRENNLEGQERRKALLHVLQGPFRPPDNQSRGTSYWESILIGRRLVLLCLYSFISTPMLRMLFMTAVVIVVLVHNILITPYKDKKAHIFSATLLSMHVVLAIINLCKSVLMTVGVNPTGPVQAQIHAFQLFEVALLGALPFVFILLFVGTLFSQLARVLVLAFQCLVKDFRKGNKMKVDINGRLEDSYRPLLNPSESESHYSEAQEENGFP